MKPLLILDCDEVILQFVAPFRQWLHDRREIDLRLGSFSLQGNMRRLKDDSLVDASEMPELLQGFFGEAQADQPEAPGAIAHLQALQREMDLVVLTNIPANHREGRVARLKALGLDVPVLANDGPKGAMVRELAGERRAVFVDDLPPHHESAAKHAPDVGRLHMVADPMLRGLIPAASQAHARIDLWDEAAPWIRTWMKG